MQSYQKTCRIHGELSQKDIRVEPTVRAERGYVLRCVPCRKEANFKQYEIRRIAEDRKRNASWYGPDKTCMVHGLLEQKDIVQCRSNKNKNGIQVRCRKCIIEQNWKTEIRRSSKNTKEIARVRSLTVYQYEQMFKDQGNVCKICKQSETRRSRTPGETCRLVVDHCHSTQRVRGLLCHACNLMIGYSKDSIAILQSAIAYLTI